MLASIEVHAGRCGIMTRHIHAQVTVIPRSEYEIPEGCRVKPGSRSSQRKKDFPPRELLRQQAAGEMAEYLKSATAAQPVPAEAAPTSEA